MLFPKAAKAGSPAVAVFFSLVIFAFVSVFPYIHSVNNPNENVRVYLTMAIVEEGTFRIDKVLERHGYVNDMAKAPDKKTGEMHLYSIKAPASSLLGVPVYWAFTKLAPHFGHPVPTPQSPHAQRVWWFTATVALLRLFSVQLPCFFFLVFFERFLRGVTADVPLRLTIVTAVGLGTNYMAYALMFVSHALFGVTAFLAFALITRERARMPEPRLRRVSVAFLAGIAAGFGTLLEYQAFPVSCALAIYAVTVFYRPTRLIAFLAGAAIDASVLMFYQWRCYGNPLTPGHKMAENPQFAAWHQSGFFGLGTPSWETFRDLSFSHAYGFFGMSPFMYLGLAAFFVGLIFVRGTAPDKATLRWASWAWLLAMIALWVPISCAINWRGGWTLGPRFFGAAPAFFGFGAAVALEQLAGHSRLRRAAVRGIAGGLALAGVVQIGVVGLVYNTFPESVTRPLVQIAIPLVRAGFVPHHAAELFGWNSILFWYLVAGAVLLAALLAVLMPWRDRVWTYLVRVALVATFFWLGMRGALGPPAPEEGAGDPRGDLRYFATIWEPADRDRISGLRIDAERHGKRAGCMWSHLADAERRLGFASEAARHLARLDPGTQCPPAKWWQP